MSSRRWTTALISTAIFCSAATRAPRSERTFDIYRICATGDRPLPRKAWAQATKLCNDWNNEHRWSKASVLKMKQENRSVAFVELNADIPVKHGTSRRMLDDFTDRVVHGTFEFFKWLHEQHTPTLSSRTSDASSES